VDLSIDSRQKAHTHGRKLKFLVHSREPSGLPRRDLGEQSVLHSTGVFVIRFEFENPLFIYAEGFFR